MQLLHLVLQTVMSKVTGNMQQQHFGAQHKVLLVLRISVRDVEEEDEKQQRRSISQLHQHREEQQRLPKKAEGGSNTESKGAEEKDGSPNEPKKPQITVRNV